MDEVSNGGFLQFSAGGILSPLPGDLHRDYGPCDYDIRQNLNAQYVYQLPLKVRSQWLGHVVNDWQVSGTLFWHSGVPFSVLSTPYSANGNGIVQGSGPQFASLVPGVDPYCRHCNLASTQPGTVQWLNPDAFVSAVDPSTGACVGGDSAANCQFGSTGRNQFRGPGFVWSDMYLTKRIPLQREAHHETGRAVLQRLQSSQLCTAQQGAGRCSGEALNADRVRGADLHHLSTDWPARRGLGRRQQSAHDRFSSKLEF